MSYEKLIQEFNVKVGDVLIKGNGEIVTFASLGYFISESKEGDLEKFIMASRRNSEPKEDPEACDLGEGECEACS